MRHLYFFITLILIIGVKNLGWAQSYSGNFFDTHLHEPDDDIPISDMIELMDNQDVEATIVFYFVETDFDEDLEMIRDDTTENPSRLVPFASVDDEELSDFLPDGLQSLLDEGEGLIAGTGEYALYQDFWSSNGIAPDDEPFISAYPILTEADAWIMIHPTSTQQADLESALSNNPDQKFLLHGPHMRTFVSDILTEFPNAYYTLDTATLIEENQSPLLYPGPGMCSSSAETFTESYDSMEDEMLTNAVDFWKPIVEASPDQIMWGTDLFCEWHITEEVYSRLLEFSRGFVARLDDAVQEKFAITNASAFFTPVSDEGEVGGGNDDDEDGDQESGGGGCSLNP